MRPDYILYSTGCPKCKILEKKLHDKGVSFGVVNDVEEMKKIGITSVPMMQRMDDGQMFDYYSAVKFANAL